MRTAATVKTVPVRFPPRKSQPFEPVSAGPLSAATDAIVAMLIESSRDPSVQACNCIPHRMDQAKARDYCAGTDGIVLYVGGRPVGVAALVRNPTARLDDNDSLAIELDVFLLEKERAHVMRWFPMIRAWATRRFGALLGQSVELHHWSDFRSGGECSGYCEVFVFERTSHPATSVCEFEPISLI